MRVVFMGTPDFAVPTLRELSGAHEVVGVFSRPDAVSGRGAKTRPSAVASLARELGVPLFQPRSLRDAEQIDAVRGLHADVIVVAAYGLILPAEVLLAAPLGAVNVHASLLPRWRGAAPIQRAILAGDTQTGVSIMRMETGLDTGPYCAQAATPIAEKSAADLTDELAESGAALLLESLPGIADGSAQWTVQDETLVTYADKVSKTDVAITPDLDVESALRRVRASLPAAPSRIQIAGRGATLIACRRAEETTPAGLVSLTKKAVVLGLADGAIEVTLIKPDGKAAMEAISWARGVRDLDGATWGAGQ